MTNPNITIVAASPLGLNIHVRLAPPAPPSPSQLTSSLAYLETLQNIRDRIAKGVGYDGRRYSFNDIELKAGLFTVKCHELKYSEACALDAARQARGLSSEFVPLLPIGGEFSGATGVATAVISADGYLLVHQRSARVGDSPLKWAIGFGEGLDAPDFERGYLAEVSVRCLAEEVGVALDKLCVDDDKLVGLVRSTALLSWEVLGIADFRGRDLGVFGVDALLASAKLAPDAWEHEQVMGILLEQVPVFFEGKPCTLLNATYLSLLQMYLEHTKAR